MDNIILRNILILLASSFLFDFMFAQIKKTNPKLNLLLDRIPKKYKGKLFIKWTFLILIIFVITLAVFVLNLNNIVGTVIIGFAISFAELIFKKPEGNRKNKK